MSSRSVELLHRVADAISDNEDLARIVLVSLGMKIPFLTISSIAQMYGAVTGSEKSQKELKSYTRRFLRTHFLDADGGSNEKERLGLVGEKSFSNVWTWRCLREPLRLREPLSGRLPNNPTIDQFLDRVSENRVDCFFIDTSDGNTSQARRIESVSTTLFYLRIGPRFLLKVLRLFPEWDFLVSTDPSPFPPQLFVFHDGQREMRWSLYARLAWRLRRSILRCGNSWDATGCLAMGEVLASVVRDLGWTWDSNHALASCNSDWFVQRSAWRATYEVDGQLHLAASWAEFVDFRQPRFPFRPLLKLQVKDRLGKAVVEPGEHVFDARGAYCTAKPRLAILEIW
ncbi:hypothetical protein [Stieleria mannarensis]|uniref:hypothetical protein n=1 Tax=Stieleria mannarensis TaxID=2755585 RepID=UPI001601792E|nr:hypothetical protein [Rhodopirellula sp. JC639]